MVQIRLNVLRVHRARKPDCARERRTARADEIVESLIISRDLLVGLGSSVGDGVGVGVGVGVCGACG